MKFNLNIDGSKVKQRRKKLKITQKQLAFMLGVGLKTVSNIERERVTDPKMQTIMKICKSLSIKIEDITNH